MIKLDVFYFNQIVKKCKPFTDRKSRQAVARIIRLHQRDKKITVTALTGARFIQTVVPSHPDSSPGEEVCYIPCDVKTFDLNEMFVEIENDKNTVQFKTAFSTQKVMIEETDYPNLRRVLSQLSLDSPQHSVYFDSKNLIEALKGPTSDSIRIDFYGDKKGITIRSPDSRAWVLPLNPASVSVKPVNDDVFSLD